MELAVATIILAVLATASAIVLRNNSRLRPSIAQVAAKAGLNYSEVDPFDCTRVRFRLFRKGHGRGAENVLWRDHDDGRSFRAFDYWYYVERTDQYGQVHKTYHRYSCAMALIGSSWPQLLIVREGLVDKALHAFGTVDIDVESEEFNRLFAVYCPDRRFATTLLAPEMIEVLLSTRGELSFEIMGRWLLVWTIPVAVDLLPGLLRVAERVVAAMPNVLWDLYPSSFVDKDGKVLPPVEEPSLLRRAQIGVAHDDDYGDGYGDDPDHDPWAVVGRSRFLPPEVDDDAGEPPHTEYDLDGHPIPAAEEDPWGPGHPPPHS